MASFLVMLGRKTSLLPPGYRGGRSPKIIVLQLNLGGFRQTGITALLYVQCWAKKHRIHSRKLEDGSA